MADQASPGITRDAFFGGRLLLDQPVTGHRSGTDAVLLAAAAPPDFVGLAYDVGSGVGAVGLGIAMARPAARVILVEKDADYAALAHANIATNGVGDRVTSVSCDVLSRDARRASLPQQAGLVVSNPPFYRADRVRASEDAGRRAAHVLDDGVGLADWLLACVDLLSPKGTLIVLHQTDAVPEILSTLVPRLGDLTLMAVYPRAGEPAVRVLVRGRKGSRAPFRIAAPLILHDSEGFTPQAAALHAGTAVLDW